MTRVENQSVPPSLIDEYSELFAMCENQYGPDLDLRHKGTRAGLSIYHPDSQIGALAMETGNWFRANWADVVPANDMPAFYTARKADIFGATFPADFWTLCTTTEDITERCYPFVVKPYNRPINPLYYDANRLPSYSIPNKILSYYTTPAKPGTELEPSPGWRGQVISGMWRDLYLAQRQFRFHLPTIQRKNATRPTVLVISATIEATASFRGVSSWFQVQTMPYFFKIGNAGSRPPLRVCSAWQREFVTPQDIPPADLFGWTYTYSTDFIRSAHAHAEYPLTNPVDALWLRVASPPSRGIFFGRNDLVQVYCTAAAHVYVARSQHA